MRFAVSVLTQDVRTAQEIRRAILQAMHFVSFSRVSPAVPRGKRQEDL